MNQLRPLLDASDLAGLFQQAIIEVYGGSHASDIASVDARFNARDLKLAVHQRGEEAFVRGAEGGEGDFELFVPRVELDPQ